jgi:nicotinamidase-related amidase
MNLDPQKTALLTLDFQNGIFGFVPGAEVIVPNAVKALEVARKRGLFVIHIGLGFSEAHPEISNSESLFKKVKDNNLFVKGTPSCEFHKAISLPDELVVYKQRVGAFSDNALQMILRCRGIDHLVFFGISTSGIVLSTVRRAFDLDFRCTIIKDACFDSDPEVHRVLTEKIFPLQATVIEAEAFVAEQNSSLNLV